MIEFNNLLDALKSMYPEILANLTFAILIYTYLRDLEKRLDVIMDRLKKK